MLYLGWFAFHPPETRHNVLSHWKRNTHNPMENTKFLDKQIAAHKMLFVGWNLLDVYDGMAQMVKSQEMKNYYYSEQLRRELFRSPR